MTIRDEPTSYDVLNTALSFRTGRVVDVRTDEVKLPGDTTAVRDVVVHPGAVGIIALDDDERLLLVQQYRHAVRRSLWEPPAGLLDEPGEDPLTTAKRELFEETHYEAATWNVLVDLFTSPGMTDEAVRIYLARNVRPADRPRHETVDEERDMPVRWVPLDEVLEAIAAGHVHNPLAVSGALAAAKARAGQFERLRPPDAPWPEMSNWPGSAAAGR